MGIFDKLNLPTMKKSCFFTFCFTLFYLSSSSQQTLSDLLTQSEKDDDLKTFLSCYDENAISMPEYQPTLQGINEIEKYYREIFKKQNIKSFKRKADEFIHLGSTVIEIGTFTKEYTDLNVDTIITLNGKYWNIWAVKPDGSFKLKGEVFGYFHPVKDPKALTVKFQESGNDYSDQKIPLELRAYNALNENYVRLKDGALRSEFYTNDARYMPSQEPTLTGLDEIRTHLIDYSKRGNITFDSLAVYTYHYEYFADYVLEYSKVNVKWSNGSASGRTEGKGIRLWKRQDDKSIKIYRHIGTHNHLE
jgi:ketosteroid isomerase-like protein